MITSKQASMIGLVGLLGLAAVAGCGSDTSGPTGSAGAFSSGGSVSTAGAPAAGAPAAGAPSAGAPSAGAPSAGAPSAGAPSAGGGAGGASAGSGGAGGTGGGSAGTGGGSAGSGGTAPTFAAVSAIMTASCATNGCHDGSNGHVSYKTNLYSVLTTPLPGSVDRCAGSTLVKASNTAGSFLITAITKGGACPVGGNQIGRMPEGCSTNAGSQKPCLTAAQIKTITDWIAAGATM